MKQVIREQKFKPRSQNFGNEKGQAVVEYVLIVLITVTLLLSARGMFKAVDDFMYSYMGAYISCLMEYGELPSQGVSADDLKKNKDGGSAGGKVCDSSFKNFTLADGVPENTSASGPGATSRSSKNSSQSASADSKTKVITNRTENSSSVTSETASNYANGRVQRATPRRGSSSGTADNASLAAGNDKVRVIEDEGDGTSTAGRGSGGIASTAVNYERIQYKALPGKLAEEQKKKANRSPTSKIISKSEDENRAGPRKSIFTPPEKRAAAGQTEDEVSFGFGNFLKWIIIAGIAISIFIFFGSQVMSFMNSKEK